MQALHERVEPAVCQSLRRAWRVAAPRVEAVVRRDAEAATACGEPAAAAAELEPEAEVPALWLLVPALEPAVEPPALGADGVVTDGGEGVRLWGTVTVGALGTVTEGGVGGWKP